MEYSAHCHTDDQQQHQRAHAAGDAVASQSLDDAGQYQRNQHGEHDGNQQIPAEA